MLLRSYAYVLLVATLLGVQPSAGNVLLRVTPGPLPSAKVIGVSDIVLHWPIRETASLTKLRALGFRVFLEAGSSDVAVAAAAAERADAAGVILEPTGSDSAANGELFRSSKTLHPKLLFRFLNPGGKQPQMKGRLVVDRDGILQVSSPSSQPWLDTNLALAKLAETFRPDAIPVLYDFHWDLSDAVQKQLWPSIDDFALAISEAEAVRADVIVDLPEPLQRALVAEEPDAWALWNQVKRYVAFSSSAPSEEKHSIANMGVVTCDEQTNYEAVNLLARHNLAFETVRPQDLSAQRLNDWNALVVFCPLNNAEIDLLSALVKRGAIVVLVNQHGEYPWQSNTPVRQDAHSATFAVGSGQVVELGEPVTEPELFARDLRRLVGAERSALGLWNSLTALVTGYRMEQRGETVLNVISYADVPENVQVQIKGQFASIQLESPEESCCRPLQAFERGGFTEFTIPRLVIAARVHLKSADISHRGP
jgi:hypothetical protein